MSHTELPYSEIANILDKTLPNFKNTGPKLRENELINDSCISRWKRSKFISYLILNMLFDMEWPINVFFYNGDRLWNSPKPRYFAKCDVDGGPVVTAIIRGILADPLRPPCRRSPPTFTCGMGGAPNGMCAASCSAFGPNSCWLWLFVGMRGVICSLLPVFFSKWSSTTPLQERKTSLLFPEIGTFIVCCFPWREWILGVRES